MHDISVYICKSNKNSCFNVVRNSCVQKNVKDHGLREPGTKLTVLNIYGFAIELLHNKMGKKQKDYKKNDISSNILILSIKFPFASYISYLVLRKGFTMN